MMMSSANDLNFPGLEYGSFSDWTKMPGMHKKMNAKYKNLVIITVVSYVKGHKTVLIDCLLIINILLIVCLF